jgi:hypothetical protein
MLKRSLFVVAAVAMLATAAQAGEIKIHNWPCAFIAQELATVPVLMDVGYWVRIKDQDKLTIKLNQISTHTYEGCKDMNVECNFNIHLSCSISPTGKIGGDYSCWINGADVNSPGGTAQVCAKLAKANLGNQPGGTKNVTVANVKIWVVPR